MFGSSIIDIAIGMVFIYLLLSLICSAANELIERYSRKRGTDLENGLKEMLRSDDLVKMVYEHPLVYSLYSKPYVPGAKTLPSYIPARNFALALMDIAAPESIKGAAGASSTLPPRFNAEAIRAFISTNANLPEPIKKALTTFTHASGNDAAKLRENVENWFDSSMDRVSGFYKRRSQLIILLLGLALSILLNVDSIALVQKLSTERAMRDSLVAAATEYAKTNPTPTPSSSPASAASPTAAASPKAQGSPASSSSRAAAGGTPSASPNPNASPSAGTIAAASPTPVASPTPCVTGDTPECRIKLNLAEINKLGLPIGWTRQESVPPDPRQLTGLTWQAWGMRILGWLITALALSLGAPFWFDMLNKFMVVRATVKPKEKSPEEASKD
jgi:hypothetical protein